MAWLKRWLGLKSKQAQGERDVANLDVNEEDAQRVLNDRAAWRKLEYINQAKHAADMRRGRPPPPFSRNVRLASYFGTGVGLYFHILEWLAIMFTCITILAVPFWVVIGRSVFTVPELVDQPEHGVKVFGEDLGSDLAQTTFAAIVDSRKDPEGTMRLMLTKLGQKWYGPQDKVDFLLWVSILDIAGVVLMVLLLCLFYYLARRFEKKVDARALDVTRFAVFAKNLPPDTSAHEVGQYFSRFGTVVDVTLVPDLTYPLRACSKLTCLEQKCGMLAAYLEQGGPLIQSLKGKLLDSTHEELLVKLNKINEKLDSDKEAQDKQVRRKRKAEEKKIKKTADPMAKIEGPSHNSHRGPVYPVKAALVTFNKRRDQEVCLMLNINAGWSGFLRNIFRVSPTKKIRGYTVRVGRAAHPDDYVYENMAVFWSRPFRFLLTQFVIFILLVACALCVTGMTNWKHFLISEEKWDLGKIEADKEFGLQQADPASISCAAVLDSCRSYFVENLEEGRRVNSLVLGDEELLKFTDSRDQQVYRSTVTSTWSRWVQEYESVQSIPDLDQKHLEAGVPACKPCYCDGLIELENSEAFIRGDDQDAFLTASEDCSIYSGDRGVQGGIATFVAVVVLGINLLLKFVVAVLTDRQKHSTFTSRDRYFALVAYGSQLLNTVLVLLITNARAASQTKNTFQEETARWLQYILLDGQNDDFGPRWYHQAGYSFMIVLFLHTLLPLIALVAGTFWQGLKRLYVRMKFWPTQADFDVAYDYPLLKLPERVADIMLSVSITLLFCSGMPLTAATLVVILIISMVVDRLNIYRFMNVVRYSPELPRLILGWWLSSKTYSHGSSSYTVLWDCGCTHTSPSTSLTTRADPCS